MPDMKEIGFMLLVLLTAVSGIYEAVHYEDPVTGIKSFPILDQGVGIGVIEELESTVLDANVTTFGNSISIGNVIETAKRGDLGGVVESIIGGLIIIWSIFAKMLSWTNFIVAILSSVGLGQLSVLFIGPLAIIQILAGFYFLRDVVNTIRGVG